MKKIVFFLFATMLVASVKAQVYVGGTVGLWHNDDLDATFFKLEPEVGYNLSEKWGSRRCAGICTRQGRRR